MSPIVFSFLVLLAIVSVGLLSIRLRKILPEHHLTSDTKDTVKLAMGLVATMTALVLGLLVASAKGNYDAQKSEVTSSAARLMVLDRTLAHYGPEAIEARQLLLRTATDMVGRIWPDAKSQVVQLDPNSVAGDEVYESIQTLQPKDDDSKNLKSQALNLSVQIGEERWLLFERSGSSISIPFLTVVICWLAVLFFSFGLFAPENGTAKMALVISAFSVSGAIFLILELDHPFDGLIHIPNVAMQIVLDHLGK